MQNSKFIIHKLFGKYDAEVDLGKSCTILIGPNGIGKSTVLKLIDKLYAGDFLSVSRYRFESIEVGGCVMQAGDFLPDDASLAEAFAKLSDDLRDADTFGDMIIRLRSRQLLGDFLYDLNKSSDFSATVSDVVEDYFPTDYMRKLSIPLYEDTHITCYKDAAVLQSDFAKLLQTGSQREVFYFDLTEKTTFPKLDSVNTGVYAACCDDRLQAFDADGKLTEFFRSADCPAQEIDNMLTALADSPLIYRFGGHSLQLDPVKGDCADQVCDYFRPYLFEMFKRDNFDISGFLNMVYYSPYHVRLLNRMAISAMKNYFEMMQNGTPVDISDILSSVTPFLSSLHESFVRPVLFKGTLFDTNLNRMVQKVKNDRAASRAEAVLLQAYLGYYKEISKYLLASAGVDLNVVSFKHMIKQYIDDKSVMLTPKGVSVLIGVHDETSEDNPFLFENLDDEDAVTIGMDKLSSGEAKIITLCFLANFFDQTVLLLDEPELSISILWQQRLIGDLLNDGTFDCIVVSTHSPYIAGNDELSEYIKYLP